MNKEEKDLAYWEANAKEDYLHTPISVLRYITELEQRMYSEEDMQEYAEFCIQCFIKNLPCIVAEDWFEQFKKK